MPLLNLVVAKSDDGWRVESRCPDGCYCGAVTFVSGFADEADAIAFRDRLVHGWPTSPQAGQLRRDTVQRLIGGAP